MTRKRSQAKTTKTKAAKVKRSQAKATKTKAARAETTVRSSLVPSSPLRSAVADGLGAVKSADRGYLADDIRGAFDDSLDLDEALRPGHEQDNRWDYLLGHALSREIVAVEPHSAKWDEVSTIIAKREAARQQLAGHQKPGARVAAWLWVASGTVHLAPMEKARRRLDEHGIRFVGRKVQAKHLP